MKALILAGGSGTRLRPLTHTGAKQLVPVANRPILFYVVDNLVDAGVVDIGVIISPETGKEVRDALGDGSKFGARFTFIEQAKPLGLAHAVVTAHEFLQDSPFVMYLGDNLIGTMIRDAVSRFEQHSELAASVMLKPVDNPSAFGVAQVDANGKVVGLEEKPQHPKSNLALVGIYLFRPVVHDAIARIKPSKRGELEITDAISKLIDMGGQVNFERVESWWLDTGKKDDILLANDTVLDDWLKTDVQADVDEHSKLSGRIRIEPGAKVERSTLRGPIIIGKNAVIRDSHIGPFTSLGDRVRVESSTVEHSVVLCDSVIDRIGRLEDSLIGRRVVVRPGTQRHGSLSLMVGDDCVVEIMSPRQS